MACNCSPAWAALTRWFALPTVLLSNLNSNPQPHPQPNSQPSAAADRGLPRSAQDPDNVDLSFDPPLPALTPQIPGSLLLGLATRWAAVLAFFILVNIAIGGYYDASLLPFFAINLATIVLLLGLATGSVLVGLQVGQGLLSALVELGEMSEEMLRGDRLPTLKIPPNLDSVETDSAP